MGDWNSKVGDKKFLNITGQYGLGDRNDAGDKLLEFCSENEMSIANTLFKHQKEDFTHGHLLIKDTETR